VIVVIESNPEVSLRAHRAIRTGSGAFRDAVIHFPRHRLPCVSAIFAFADSSFASRTSPPS
jgi:hypothetical protein